MPQDHKATTSIFDAIVEETIKAAEDSNFFDAATIQRLRQLAEAHRLNRPEALAKALHGLEE